MSFIHGGNIIAKAQELGVGVADLIDMSSNLTPLGPVPGIEDVYQAAFTEIGCLPESTSLSLRRAFSRKFSCEVEEVIAGNGTTEFIYDLAVKVEASRVVIVNPTYSDYRLGCEYAGLQWYSFSLSSPHFQLSVHRLEAELQGGELVFICNPNNPTGTMVDVARLYELVKIRADVNFVVDESYLPFTDQPSLLGFPRLDNLFILCSSSKIYGIPGLRLGFMVSSRKSLVPFLSKQKPWVVNRPAQLCGEFLLLQGDDYIYEVVAYIQRVKSVFMEGLHALDGVVPVAGVTNFILCQLTGSRSVAVLQKEMLQQHIMIRNCQSFDSLSGQYFRISLQDEEKNGKCLQVLEKCLL